MIYVIKLEELDCLKTCSNNMKSIMTKFDYPKKIWNVDDNF